MYFPQSGRLIILKKPLFFDTVFKMDITQLLGYSASFIIFISLMMKSIIKLRILNALGCLLFVVFAFKTNSWPAVVMNIGIVFIDMYYFYKMMQIKDNFEILEVGKDNEVVRYFFEKNKQELATLFGSNALNKSEKIALYFRNNDIAGVVAYTVKDVPAGKIATLLIDFVVIKYRDLAVGKHFFIDDLSFWKRQGITTFTIEQPANAHIHYLKQLGFTCNNDTGIWTKVLNS